MKDMNLIKQEFNEALKTITDVQTLGEVRVKYFGKKGEIAGLMAFMREAKDKKVYGELVNSLRDELTSTFNEIETRINNEVVDAKLKTQSIDTSLPSRENVAARQNILIKTARDIENIFTNLGYEIATGPEIESDYHNFEALNLSKDHPARDMQDSFYITDTLLMRTHTSGIQSRTLVANDGPLKIICPGKVYRRDDDDATHSHQFMQIEGLCVVNKSEDIDVSLAELKSTLTIFANKIFDRDDLEIRFRPSFFPFTEPSVEVDITCSRCGGSGCGFCKKTGFIEVLGAGVIHKNVLTMAGYDAEEYTGFAFGIGVERIALLKYNIEDIRNLYINDYRFLDQF